MRSSFAPLAFTARAGGEGGQREQAGGEGQRGEGQCLAHHGGTPQSGSECSTRVADVYGKTAADNSRVGEQLKGARQALRRPPRAVGQSQGLEFIGEADEHELKAQRRILIPAATEAPRQSL